MINVKKKNIDEINSEDLKPLQIIIIALNMGVFLFMVVTFILYFQNIGKISEPQGIDTLNILMIILFTFTIIDLFLSRIIPGRVFVKKDFDINISVRSYYIIRFAMMETAAFLSLVVFILSIMGGAIYHYPVYWLVLLPVLIFFYISFLIFPNHDRVKDLLREKAQA